VPPPDQNGQVTDERNLEVIITNSPEDPHIVKGKIGFSETN
jgi:hypothetical protein